MGKKVNCLRHKTSPVEVVSCMMQNTSAACSEIVLNMIMPFSYHGIRQFLFVSINKVLPSRQSIFKSWRCHWWIETNKRSGSFASSIDLGGWNTAWNEGINAMERSNLLLDHVSQNFPSSVSLNVSFIYRQLSMHNVCLEYFHLL